MKYGCRTRTLCLEEGPPRWPPSSGECSLLVHYQSLLWTHQRGSDPVERRMQSALIALFYSVHDQGLIVLEQAGSGTSEIQILYNDHPCCTSTFEIKNLNTQKTRHVNYSALTKHNARINSLDRPASI